MNENSNLTLDLSYLFREKEASIWYNIYDTESIMQQKSFIVSDEADNSFKLIMQPNTVKLRKNSDEYYKLHSLCKKFERELVSESTASFVSLLLL